MWESQILFHTCDMQIMAPKGTDMDMQASGQWFQRPTSTNAPESHWVSEKMYINARDATIEEHEQNHTIVFHENQEAINKKYIE